MKFLLCMRNICLQERTGEHLCDDHAREESELPDAIKFELTTLRCRLEERTRAAFEAHLELRKRNAT